MSIKDLNFMYKKLCGDDETYILNCKNKKKISPNIFQLIDQKRSYVCCLYNNRVNQCILHQCVVIALQSWLDKLFRKDFDEHESMLGVCFIMNGHYYTIPNIMMNNNIQIHNFCSPQYSRNAKRLYLYGNFCPEGDLKRYGQSIQLVYEPSSDVLHVRDVYGQDYLADDELIKKIVPYFCNNHKWPEVGFLFDENISTKILKTTMKNIYTGYHIDTLRNKLILSPSQLLETFFCQNKKLILFMIERNIPVQKLVKESSRNMMQSIIDGQIFKSISKTLSTQKIFRMNPRLQEYTSKTNRDVNIFDLKFKSSDEITKIISKDVSYKANMQYPDYRYFIDQCDHGELHAAGKTFTRSHDVILPNIDYDILKTMLTSMVNHQILSTNLSKYLLVFNSCPTKYYIHDIDNFIITVKSLPIEIRMFDNLICINYHVGLIVKQVMLSINNKIISSYATPFEMHDELSMLKNNIILQDDKKPIRSMLSRTTLYYCNDHTDVFHQIPPAKIMVFMRNLKNASPVFHDNDFKPSQYIKYMKNENRNCVVVNDPAHYCNDKMIFLWTMIGDIHLKTTEDPYIPNSTQPFYLYNIRSIILRGSCIENKNGYFLLSNANDFKIIETLFGYVLINVCQITSEFPITWNTLGKKLKITSLKSKNMYVYKIMMYVHDNFKKESLSVHCEAIKINKEFIVKIRHVFCYDNFTGIKLCSIHGQKGVTNVESDLNDWVSEDRIHPQLMISPISFLNRQTIIGDNIDKKFIRNGEQFSVMYKIPYTIFHTTPDDAHTEYCDQIKTGLEKIEGTRLDNYTINNHYVSNMQTLNLQDIRSNSHDQHFNNHNYNTSVSLINTWHINLID
nr:late expression factor 8 [Neodiprion sertifer nucleopolyhedrovirus]